MMSLFRQLTSISLILDLRSSSRFSRYGLCFLRLILYKILKIIPFNWIILIELLSFSVLTFDDDKSFATSSWPEIHHQHWWPERGMESHKGLSQIWNTALTIETVYGLPETEKKHSSHRCSTSHKGHDASSESYQNLSTYASWLKWAKQLNKEHFYGRNLCKELNLESYKYRILVGREFLVCPGGSTHSWPDQKLNSKQFNN